MSSLRSGVALLGAVVLAGVLTQAHAKAGRFGFGKPATPEEIAAWDIDVRPDGAGLPPGRGSVAQGQAIYDAKCASCHGTFGESNDYMALAGGIGSLGTDQPMRTTGSKLNHATTLWDYINRAMPFQSPKSLTADEVYALTAFLLSINEVIPEDSVLDAQSLPKVKMPIGDAYAALPEWKPKTPRLKGYPY
jgi:S-disulfanyl-L-cysteine oxidoreductase SoxD